MYKISDAFKNKIYSGNSEGYVAKLTINDKEVPNTQIASITLSMPIFDDTAQTFYIGTVISNKLTLKFKNLDGLDIVTGNRVHLEIGRDIDGTVEYVPMGEYLIDDLTEDYQKTCQITCMDYLVKMKTNLDIRGAFTDGKTTLDNLLKWVCGFYEIELGTYPSINGDVETSVYDNTVSGKGWLSYIAETKGSNVKMSRDNKLCLIPFKQDAVTTIDALHTTSSFTIGEKYQISNVTYVDAIRNFTFGDDTANTLFIRQNNPFIQSNDVVENIYNAVKGMTIYPLSYKTSYGNVALDPYDVIAFTTDEDSDGNLLTYNVYNNCTLVFDQDITSDIEVKIPTKQNEVTTNVVEGDTRSQINRVRTEVDNLQQQITMQATTTTNIQNALNDTYYTINQIDELIEKASTGLTNTFTTSGGNNIFRNTGLWFKNTGDEAGINPYEYWVGNVSRVSESKASNLNALSLLKGTVSQSQSVSNGTYTISFKYKKLVELTNVSVNINGENMVLDSTYATSYTKTIDVQTGLIEVDFVCDVDNGCEIYDIMVNAGDSAMAYAQNQNETTTDSVNISKGISITSSDTNTTFKAGSDGIRIYNNDDMDSPSTHFTDQGTETKNITVNEKAIIGNLLIEEVGDQTWLARL